MMMVFECHSLGLFDVYDESMLMMFLVPLT